MLYIALIFLGGVSVVAYIFRTSRCCRRKCLPSQWVQSVMREPVPVPKPSPASCRASTPAPPPQPAAFCRQPPPVCLRNPVPINPETVVRRSIASRFPESLQQRLVANARLERYDRVRQLFADIGVKHIAVGENRGSLYRNNNFCGMLEFGLGDAVILVFFDRAAYLHVRTAIQSGGFSESTLIERKLDLEFRPWPQVRVQDPVPGPK